MRTTPCIWLTPVMPPHAARIVSHTKAACGGTLPGSSTLTRIESSPSTDISLACEPEATSASSRRYFFFSSE
uniref:hypothetical protein n=1 Tax=Frigoriglobus tundricola TaxID=2774151 RepID=UPI00148EEE11